MYKMKYIDIHAHAFRKPVPFVTHFHTPAQLAAEYDKFGIEAGPNIKLPHPDCLMVTELEPGALNRMSGFVDYSFYDALHEG